MTYQVWAKVFSTELRKQIKIVVGEFDNRTNANLFAEVYESFYKTKCDIELNNKF